MASLDVSGVDVDMYVSRNGWIDFELNPATLNGKEERRDGGVNGYGIANSADWLSEVLWRLSFHIGMK